MKTKEMFKFVLLIVTLCCLFIKTCEAYAYMTKDLRKNLFDPQEKLIAIEETLDKKEVVVVAPKKYPIAPRHSLRSGNNRFSNLSKEERDKEYRVYNMELIRAKGKKGIPLPIPLNKQETMQLVSEGSLPFPGSETLVRYEADAIPILEAGLVASK